MVAHDFETESCSLTPPIGMESREIVSRAAARICCVEVNLCQSCDCHYRTAIELSLLDLFVPRVVSNEKSPWIWFSKDRYLLLGSSAMIIERSPRWWSYIPVGAFREVYYPHLDLWFKLSSIRI
jgi:hypothetical protein